MKFDNFFQKNLKITGQIHMNMVYYKKHPLNRYRDADKVLKTV